VSAQIGARVDGSDDGSDLPVVGCSTHTWTLGHQESGLFVGLFMGGLRTGGRDPHAADRELGKGRR
jgi:hypothetical protein